MPYGNYPPDTVPESLLETATRDVSHYVVSFVIEHECSGSGTLVHVNDSYGVLTASHVAKRLFKSPDPSVAIICAAYKHRLLVDKNYLENIEIGSTRDESDLGPDLVFIKLFDSVAIENLVARKSFYNLVGKSLDDFREPQPRGSLLCFISGSPVEMATYEGTKGKSDFVLSTKLFVARAQIDREYERDCFDYIRLGILAGRSGFPSDYRGMSGGGVWYIPLVLDPQVGLDSLHHEAPTLIGVAFYQSDFKDGTRYITAHGPNSLYKIALNKLLKR